MTFNRLLVYLFRFLSIALGLPSMAGTAYFGWAAYQIQLQDSAPSRAAEPSGNQAVDILQTAAHTAGAVFAGLGTLGTWVVWLLLAICLIGLVFAGVLWLTAGGLAKGQMWARIVAVICGLFLLSSLGGGIATLGFHR